MNNCGWSGRPSFSVTRTKARKLPSGDQRGDESRIPLVSCFASLVAVETIQMDVLYPSFLSFTVTFTNATREPSGATCGSAIQLKLNKSFSVMFLFWPNTEGTKIRIMTNANNSRRRMQGFPFAKKGLTARVFYLRILPGVSRVIRVRGQKKSDRRSDR